MKKYMLIGLYMFLFLGMKHVYAQDTVYSINKNDNEVFQFIIDSYNEKEQIDGNLLVGTFLKEEIEIEDKTYEDDQIMAIKYDDNGNIVWSYRYGKNGKDTVIDVIYTYDETGKIDGYAIIMPTTYSQEEQSEARGVTILKISLDGKFLYEKPSGIDDQEEFHKISYATENKVDGYIAVGNKKIDQTKEVALLVRYDRDFNILWIREFPKGDYQSIDYIDVSMIQKDSIATGYAVLKELTTNDGNKEVSLLSYNLEGEEETIWNPSLEKYDGYSLALSKNGVLLYGLTEDVKLEKGEASYYILNYSDGEEQWESIGEIPIPKKSKVKVLPIWKEKELSEYLMMVQSSDLSSTEVIKIDLEGMFLKKIKKIATEYYDISSFNFRDNTIYMAGQINCPKDDTCDYDTNSLFLISDEEKVIEVQDKASKKILIGICIVIFLGVLLSFIKNKRKKLLR